MKNNLAFKYILKYTTITIKKQGLFYCLRYFELIDDITFEFIAIHCGIGRGIKQKKISLE